MKILALNMNCRVKQIVIIQWQFQEFILGWSLRNLSYAKSDKEIIGIYEHHKKHTDHEVYNLFLLTKRKRKKGLKIENVQMKIIK